MNKFLGVGRLTKNPELKTTQGGVNVCSFTIAINRRFKNEDGNYDADFINCVAWRNNAEFICRYFKKGEVIGIVGSIQTRKYDKDGQTTYVTEVVCDEASFVSSNKKENQDDKEENNASSEIFDTINNSGYMPMGVDDSDIPF